MATALEGKSLSEVRGEILSLTVRADLLTHALRTCPMTPQVRANVEAERNGIEWRAAGLEAELAEGQGIAAAREASEAPDPMDGHWMDGTPMREPFGYVPGVLGTGPFLPEDEDEASDPRD